MDVYGEILRGTALPRFFPLCQRFDRAEVPDAGEAVRCTLCEAGVLERLRPGGHGGPHGGQPADRPAP